MNKKIRILVLAFIFLAFISVACGKTTMVDKTSKVDGKAAGKASSDSVLTDDEVYELYFKAREAYEWFDMTTIPFDSEKYIEVDNWMHFEVVQPGINSKKDLEDYLNGIFTEDITEELMNLAPDRFIESDGKLYVVPADRGASAIVGDETYEIIREADDFIIFKVTVEIYNDPNVKEVIAYEEYQFFLGFTNKGWRFLNFGLVR